MIAHTPKGSIIIPELLLSLSAAKLSWRSGLASFYSFAPRRTLCLLFGSDINRQNVALPCKAAKSFSIGGTQRSRQISLEPYDGILDRSPAATATQPTQATRLAIVHAHPALIPSPFWKVRQVPGTRATALRPGIALSGLDRGCKCTTKERS